MVTVNRIKLPRNFNYSCHRWGRIDIFSENCWTIILHRKHLEWDRQQVLREMDFFDWISEWTRDLSNVCIRGSGALWHLDQFLSWMQWTKFCLTFCLTATSLDSKITSHHLSSIFIFELRLWSAVHRHVAKGGHSRVVRHQTFSCPPKFVCM